MSDLILPSINNFLRKNHFNNPTISKISENLQSSLYLVKEGDSEITIKVFNKKELETLYQLNEKEFLSFMQLQTRCINDVTQRVAATPLIRFDNSFVQEYDSLLFYVMQYIPGEIRDISAINSEQKQNIARTLKQIHQTDMSSYDTALFSVKIDFFVRSWQFFLNNQGINLVRQLTASFQDESLNNFLQQISNNVTSEAIWDIHNSSNVVITHSDIKPKNVIWNNKNEFFLIDWEGLCAMRPEIDFIDTITSWTLEKNDHVYELNNDELKLFRDAYALPLTIKEIDIYFSAAKWMFWIMTCYAQSNHIALNEGLRMLQLLANNQDVLLKL